MLLANASARWPQTCTGHSRTSFLNQYVSSFLVFIMNINPFFLSYKRGFLISYVTRTVHIRAVQMRYCTRTKRITPGNVFLPNLIRSQLCLVQ